MSRRCELRKDLEQLQDDRRRIDGLIRVQTADLLDERGHPREAARLRDLPSLESEHELLTATAVAERIARALRGAS